MKTTWTRQIWYSQLIKVTLLQSRIVVFQLLSKPNTLEQLKSRMDLCWINDKSTMDQRWINDGSTIIYNMSHTQEMCYLQLQYWMECENGDQTAWTHQIWHSEIMKVTLLQSSIVPFNLLRRICGTRLYRRWINDRSTMYRWHLHCLYLQLLMTHH